MTRRRRKPWYQFSLRSLLILVTLCALLCSYAGTQLARYRRQQRALTMIREAGWVVYNYDVDENGQVLNVTPPDTLLRRTVRQRDHFFGRLFGVYFAADNMGPTDASDRILAGVSLFPDLRELWVTHAIAVTDDGLVHIRKPKHLEVLDLQLTPITDRGLAHISHLSELRDLNLARTPVTDAGLVSLEKMTSLEWVDLRETDVTEAGVKRLQAALPRCGIETELDDPDPFLKHEDTS